MVKDGVEFLKSNNKKCLLFGFVMTILSLFMAVFFVVQGAMDISFLKACKIILGKIIASENIL
ncbi:MAG: hypothetical protein RSC41_05515, partial [Oscillospiraceae bacterium]